MSEKTDSNDAGERMVGRREVQRAWLPASDRTIRRAEARGEFPHRVMLTPRVPAWRLSELRQWAKDPGRWAAEHRRSA